MTNVLVTESALKRLLTVMGSFMNGQGASDRKSLSTSGIITNVWFYQLYYEI